MPSIRIRGSTYSNLAESPSTSPVARPLTTLFVSNAESAAAAASTLPQSSTTPRIRQSMPTLRIEAADSESTQIELPPQVELRPSARPRSGTTSSRVHTYCVGSSRRYPRAPTDDNSDISGGRASPLLMVPRESNGMIMMDGLQADVMMRYNGEPGVIGSALSLTDSNGEHDNLLAEGVHHDDVVEHLDVIDPQVGTVSNLTNAANSILIPPLAWISRKPVLVLNGPPPSANQDPEELDGYREKYLQDSLDRHVDDVLRRPSKFRRTLMGVWSFLKTPLGVCFIMFSKLSSRTYLAYQIFAAIYGFCVVFWGAAIVFFVGKLINLHDADKQGFWVEVSSQVENGLFTVTGIGLIPFRVLDTYRTHFHLSLLIPDLSLSSSPGMYWIWHYKRKTRKLRTTAGLPQLFDEDDLPDPKYDPNYVHVLTEEEESLALLICLLNDGNSIFQVGYIPLISTVQESELSSKIMLCGTMWGLDRFQRPAWSTGILIPCSFLCGIFAAVFIWQGGQKTKRVAEVEERLKAALIATDDYQEQTNGDAKCSDSNSRSTAVEKMGQLPDDVEENETAVDELMTIPSHAGKETSPTFSP
ncbi:hypothetical protein DXG03_000319 [Asterophora parasitica]|uniref:Uncharacterized protein n=1 Tax=Asterophora parasitica TaxID=117018 RepID=A0A9P7GKH8_9AGAR|nr:hypothetical protein DXG03_000319 [Asterophora parasitica]